MPAGTKAPPMPVHPPDVHLRGKKRKPTRTLKGDLHSLRNKAIAAGGSWKSGRESSKKKQEDVRVEAKEILAPVQDKITEEKGVIGELMEPVKKVVGASRGSLTRKDSKGRPYVTSFAISCAASWAIGPQIFTSLYGWARFGVFPQNWGLLQGPGRWFRDTVTMARETDRMGSLTWAAIMGLLPMVIMFTRNMAANHLGQSAYRGRLGTLGIKWLTRLAYLAPITYFVGIAYPEQVEWIFGSPWTLEWWQFWVAGLFCLTFYFTLWILDRVEKRLPPGATHIVLMIPMASIVTGFCLDAPGAAW